MIYNNLPDDGSRDFIPPWLARRYGDDGSGGASTPPPAPPPDPFQSILPTPGQVGSLAPQPYTAFGDIPYIAPTYMDPAQVAPVAGPQAAQVGLTQMPGALSAFQQELMTALAPQFLNQQQGMDANLASRGIFSSGAGQQAQNDLFGQQAAAIAQPMGALTQQFADLWGQGALQNAAQAQEANMLGYQGNLQAQIQNALLNQSANQFNAGVANDAAGANAQAYANVANQYGNNYNAFLASMLGQGSNLSQGLLGILMGSYDPNNSATSILGQGAANAGSAYEDAYNQGQARGGIFGNAFGTALGQLGSRSTPAVNMNGVASTGDLVQSVTGG